MSPDDPKHRAPAPPPEVTAEYLVSGAATGAAPDSPHVLRLARRSGGDQVDLQILLRQRLRLIATVVSIASGLSSAQKLLSIFQVGYPSMLDLARAMARWPDLLMGLLNIVVYGVAAYILWRRKLPSLRRLRAFELLIFGK